MAGSMRWAQGGHSGSVSGQGGCGENVYSVQASISHVSLVQASEMHGERFKNTCLL